MPFKVSIRSSFFLAMALLTGHVGAMYWLWCFEWGVVLKLVAGAALLGSIYWNMKRYVFFSSAKSIVSVVRDGAEQWCLHTANGEILNATLLRGVCFQPWLVVMHFRVEGHRLHWPVVVMADSTDSVTFRRLQAKLRYLFSAR